MMMEAFPKMFFRGKRAETPDFEEALGFPMFCLKQFFLDFDCFVSFFPPEERHAFRTASSDEQGQLADNFWLKCAGHSYQNLKACLPYQGTMKPIIVP